MGAGQGRDSNLLSNMVYEIISVDISQVGLNQIEEVDTRITTLVADIYCFNISGYTYIFLDSILHFYKKDKEVAFLKQILSQMNTGEISVNCLLKREKSENILNTLFLNLSTFFMSLRNYKKRGNPSKASK